MEKVPNLPNEIRWEIANSEQKEKERNKVKMILKLLPVLVVISFTMLLSVSPVFPIGDTLKSFVLFWIFMSIVVALLFFKNSIWTYKKRTYYLNSLGFEVSRVNKKDFFEWTDFECYYKYSRDRWSENSANIERNRTMTSGEIGEISIKEGRYFENEDEGIYYLKKKRVGIWGIFCKTFILIYTEADSDKIVDKYISLHLPKKMMTATTDMGMV